MTITATLAGAISMLAQFGLFFGGGNNRDNPLGGDRRAADGVPRAGRRRAGADGDQPHARVRGRPRRRRDLGRSAGAGLGAAQDLAAARSGRSTSRPSATRRWRTCTSSTRCRARGWTICSRPTPTSSNRIAELQKIAGEMQVDATGRRSRAAQPAAGDRRRAAAVAGACRRSGVVEERVASGARGADRLAKAEESAGAARSGSRRRAAARRALGGELRPLLGRRNRRWARPGAGQPAGDHGAAPARPPQSGDRAICSIAGCRKRAGTFEAMLRLSLAQLLYLPELGDHSARCSSPSRRPSATRKSPASRRADECGAAAGPGRGRNAARCCPGTCCSPTRSASNGARPMAPRPIDGLRRRAARGAAARPDAQGRLPGADRAARRHGRSLPTPCGSTPATSRSSSCPAMPRAAGGCRMPRPPSRRA